MARLLCKYNYYISKINFGNVAEKIIRMRGIYLGRWYDILNSNFQISGTYVLLVLTNVPFFKIFIKLMQRILKHMDSGYHGCPKKLCLKLCRVHSARVPNHSAGLC